MRDQRQVSIDSVLEHQLATTEQTATQAQRQLDELAHRHRLLAQDDLVVLELGEVENVVHQMSETTSARGHHSEVLAGPRRDFTGRAIEDRLGNANDAVERSPQLVRGVGEKLVLHAVDLAQPLCFFAVARDLPLLRQSLDPHVAKYGSAQRESVERVGPPRLPWRWHHHNFDRGALLIPHPIGVGAAHPEGRRCQRAHLGASAPGSRRMRCSSARALAVGRDFQTSDRRPRGQSPRVHAGRLSHRRVGGLSPQRAGRPRP
jgi:hypothetical protein